MLKQALAATLLLAAPGIARADTIVLAGGCFWGMEATFEHVKGVTNVVSGYAGGSAADANYDAVSSERTGHAEAIRVTYDPKQVSLGELLGVYFIVAHDPTQLNRQTPDEGPSYRSAVFPQSARQRQFVDAYLKTLNARAPFSGRIVTRIESGTFFPAEAYHQDFMRKNPRHPYILRWDVPKLAKLKATYPALYRGR
ncbi:peptide-methionine (S)-S-oxide reductase MsrA [Novosphingobium sp.]|uniref:peptide-methionine (S)-S-oxide reductase MsrA n=1 Tax=Novosphingobium sp. TaxID=1874826 RepID=UPI0025D02090|nr:peptide-methionine (S)-S-oxide reductase MsrA [Novosphingobium sp.]MCC6926495.1 peptide-methionine (S)-S-oxide reductase MsrA [Novosphingobium sp.]